MDNQPPPPGPTGDPASDPWQALRRYTAARIALGHAGISQPTRVQLDFQLAHAMARDAVHTALDGAALAAGLAAAWPELSPALLLHSAARERSVYLQRPDLGRRLDRDARAVLAAARPADPRATGCDLAIVVADGLSALAVARNAAPLLQALRPLLTPQGWRIAPPCIVEQGRVAIGDEAGELLGAKMVMVLIGERPGLSAPDSMGVYLTWAPRVGLTDESRNCVSNIRPAGQRVEEAAARLHYLLVEAFRRQLTGVGLKDDTGGAGMTHDGARTFIL